VFRHSPLSNPLLLFGTMAAQLVHIGAMYTPWIRDVLAVRPVTPRQWFGLLAFALTILAVMQAYKALARISHQPPAAALRGRESAALRLVWVLDVLQRPARPKPARALHLRTLTPPRDEVW
jgi:hypothetical protein